MKGFILGCILGAAGLYAYQNVTRSDLDKAQASAKRGADKASRALQASAKELRK